MTHSAPTSAILFDWPETLKRYNNKKFALSLLKLFSKDLTELQQQMKQHHRNNCFSDLTRTIHKIHGACCFLVVPQLETYAHNLYIDLKKNNFLALPKQLDELDSLITRLLIAIEPYLNKIDKKEK